LWVGSTTEEAMPGAPCLIQVKAAVADPSKCEVWQLCYEAMYNNIRQSHKGPDLHLSDTCKEGACCVFCQPPDLRLGLHSMGLCCREIPRMHVWADSLACCQSSEQASDQAKQQRNILIFLSAPRHDHSIQSFGLPPEEAPVNIAGKRISYLFLWYSLKPECAFHDLLALLSAGILPPCLQGVSCTHSWQHAVHPPEPCGRFQQPHPKHIASCGSNLRRPCTAPAQRRRGTAAATSRQPAA